MVGVLAAAGGATYYFTDKYGSPDALIAKAIPAGFGAPAVGVPAGDAPASPSVPAGPPPVGPPPPMGPASAAGGDSFAATIGAFDYQTQHLIWVLPPGIHAEGPFVAKVTVTHNGAVKHTSEIPLKATRLQAGSRSEFPAGSDVVRLSADDTWPAKRDQIKGIIDRLKSQHGADGGELEIVSEFKPKIEDAYRRQYCMQGDKIAIDLYLEDGQPGALKKLDLADSQSILQRAILTGGCTA